MNKRPFLNYLRPTPNTPVFLGAVIGIVFGLSTGIITGQAENLAYLIQQTGIHVLIGSVIGLGLRSSLLGVKIGLAIGSVAGVLASIYVRHGMSNAAAVVAFVEWIILGAFFGSLCSISWRLLRRRGLDTASKKASTSSARRTRPTRPPLPRNDT